MPEMCRRSAIASTVYHPCFRAFLFPFGAPGDGPPCIRQRPFGIAGDWQGLPLRVFAPQRGLDCMSKSMGLSLDFGRWASPRRLVDVAYDGMSALTVTCLTVICCCPAPRWRSRRSVSIATVR